MWSEIFVAVTTGVVTAWISVKTFQHQRLWENKSAAYKEMLEALQAMKAANDELYNDEITYRSMSEARSSELAAKWRAGKVIAYKFADIGSLEMSDRIEAILQQLRNELENHPERHSMFEELDQDGGAIERALRAAKDVAIRDARHSGQFWIPRWLAKLDTRTHRKKPVESISGS